MNIPGWITRINENVLARNLILAACAIVVFIFLVSTLLNLFTRHGTHKTVPDFTGVNVADARGQARHASLRMEIHDSIYVPAYPGGTVLDQNPKPGAQVKAGRRIFVTTNAYSQRKVDIPYVTGYSLRQAKNMIEVAGLEIDKLVYRSDLATNYVLEERYEGRLITRTSNERAELGSGITLVVGMGSDGVAVRVPKVVGFPLKEAKSRLWEIGLNIGSIDMGDVTPLNINEARVFSQSPDQGASVMLGRTVNLKVTLDEKVIEQGSKASDRAARQTAEQQAEDVIEAGLRDQATQR